jgi:hypothetical protein
MFNLVHFLRQNCVYISHFPTNSTRPSPFIKINLIVLIIFTEEKDIRILIIVVFYSRFSYVKSPVVTLMFEACFETLSFKSVKEQEKL